MRKVEFNEHQTLEAAMLTFWQDGYAATSLAKLQAVTGLSKGSLYNSFGSKEELFRRALALYLERLGQQMATILKSHPLPEIGLPRMMHEIVASSTVPPHGCLLIVAIMERADLSLTTRKLLKTAYARRHERLAGYLQLSKGADAPLLARSILTIVDGLLVAARHGHSAEELNKVVDLSLHSLGFTGTKKDQRSYL